MFEMLEQEAFRPRGGHQGRRGEELAPTDPLARADRAHAEAGRAFRALLRAVVELERTGRAREEGARDTAHLLQMRYGLSGWKARRAVEAAGALEQVHPGAVYLHQGETYVVRHLEPTAG